eukprot:5774051-Alexandrium_andersonii.AAC.1
MCAKLLRSLYGARAAPFRWEALYTETLESFGFVRGKASACCVHHLGWGVKCVVHGGDFAFTGRRRGPRLGPEPRGGALPA